MNSKEFPGPRRGWVLLHGFTGGPGSWDEIRAMLEPHGPVLCPALVGHGSDTGDASDFNDEVDRIAGLVTDAGAEGFDLCGYSLGARVALGLLVRYPALFRQATLIGVNPGLPEGDPARAERAAGDERWARLAEASPERFVAEWGAQPLFATQRELSPAAQAERDRLRGGHDFRALAAAMRALSLATMPDWSPSLPALTIPVHLVVGERDAKFVALAAPMARAIAQVRLTVVAGAGHNVPLEQPSRVAQLLLE